MKGVKNLKIMAASLCLSATLLTGCGQEKIQLRDNDLVITEDGKITGIISYEALENSVKMVTFEQNNKTNHYLVLKRITTTFGSGDRGYHSVSYTDLETGACMISYVDYYNLDNEIEWYLGESLNIKNEDVISPYLVSEDFVKKEYTVEEILTFFEEKIEPTLDGNEKELIK